MSPSLYDATTPEWYSSPSWLPVLNCARPQATPLKEDTADLNNSSKLYRQRWQTFLLGDFEGNLYVKAAVMAFFFFKNEKAVMAVSGF